VLVYFVIGDAIRFSSSGAADMLQVEASAAESLSFQPSIFSCSSEVLLSPFSTVTIQGAALAPHDAPQASPGLFQACCRPTCQQEHLPCGECIRFLSHVSGTDKLKHGVTQILKAMCDHKNLPYATPFASLL
jgi:hypothetical protein